MRESYVVRVVKVLMAQSKLRRKPAPERILDRLKAERVEGRLRAVPAWRVSRDGGFLRRTRRFPTVEEALVYTHFVESLSRTRGIPVIVTPKGKRVVVVLHGEKTRRGWGPLTDAQLDIAAVLS
jgi:pterin-4a-carbinolamine dehydratase